MDLIKLQNGMRAKRKKGADIALEATLLPVG
jgi:hypothetical protein